jgi:hypothetical protein
VRRLLPLLALASCSGGSSHPAQDAAADAPAGCANTASLERLSSEADFACLEGEAWEVKYLAQVNGRKAPAPLDRPCVFQNTARYPLHVNFMRSFPPLATLDFDTYLTLVMNAASRVLWAGELKLLPGAAHPRTGKRGVLAYFVYTGEDERDALTAAQIAEVDARLKQCVPYAKDLLVLVGTDQKQAQRFAAQATELRGRGIDVGDPLALRAGVGAEGYSLGEGYGFLRVSAPGAKAEDYGPRDVLVAESGSEDLRLLAGLITALPQNLHSHVNLRLREKMIPNAFVADIFKNPILAQLDGKLVHLTVAEKEARLEPALLEDAEAFWASRHPQARQPVANLEETRLRDMSELRAADAVAFGSKAANVAELYQVLPPANRVSGFGIPFSAYRDFMRAAGLEARVEALLADPRAKSDAAFRREQLAALRAAITSASVPEALLARVTAAAAAAFGADGARTPLRFRSSSNVEDGELISGAGLHDSARACMADDADGDDRGPSACVSAEEQAFLAAELARRQEELRAHPDRTWLAEIVEDLSGDLRNERTAARALGKVYASLWNERAFEEREYWGIDHRKAFMGIAVHPAFVLEKLDAVAVTQVDGGPLYRVVSQRDGQGVVRPADPTQVAETLTFRRGDDGKPADVQVLVRSSLSAEPLWRPERLAELASLLFKVHDHFAAQVYARIPRLSLDMEIKLTSDDRIVIKQVRPYVQTGP